MKQRIKNLYALHFQSIVFLLMISYMWETLEHYLETSIESVAEWMAGVEFWGNRLITDNLCVVAGYFIVYHYPMTKIIGRIASILFWGVHVFIFPHSMYLHEIFPNSFGTLWGDKTTSWFDFWSFEHIFAGIALGTFVLWWERKITKRIVGPGIYSIPK